MARMYYDNDADLNELKGLKLCVLGYGSQGRGQSLNLRDSGLDVTLGLRRGSPSFAKAEADGMKALPLEEALEGADLVAMLTPDTTQAALYRDYVAPSLKPEAALLFSHGFNVHFNQIQPPSENDVLMVAPKGPGNLVREVFEAGGGVPCLYAVHQDATGRATQRALAYAKAVGGTRAGTLATTFAEETETDLFGEQAVLCGGATALVKAGFETLTEAGYQPEVAYFECLHELKLIVDLMQREGLQGMRRAISDTAKFGDLTRGSRIVDEHVRNTMREVLSEIRDGTFAHEWLKEDADGRPNYNKLMQADNDHQLEHVGSFLRDHMQWLKKDSKTAQPGHKEALLAGR